MLIVDITLSNIASYRTVYDNGDTKRRASFDS